MPSQHTSLSPSGKLLVIVGDNPEGMLVDSQTGKVIYFTLSIEYVWILIHMDPAVEGVLIWMRSCRL